MSHQASLSSAGIAGTAGADGFDGFDGATLTGLVGLTAGGVYGYHKVSEPETGIVGDSEEPLLKFIFTGLAGFAGFAITTITREALPKSCRWLPGTVASLWTAYHLGRKLERLEHQRDLRLRGAR